MKKIRMGLIALSALTGVGSAFAFNLPKKHFNPQYYAIKVDANTLGWTNVRPAQSCHADPLANGLACTITSATPQATVLNTTNAYPADHGSETGFDQLHK